MSQDYMSIEELDSETESSVIIDVHQLFTAKPLRLWRACSNFKMQLALLLIHAGMLVLNILIWSAYSTERSATTAINAPLLPLAKIMRHERTFWNLTLGQRTIYTQDPSTNVDAAWDEITAPPGKVGFILSPNSLLEKENLSSVQVIDGSGSLATIDVFHQLHCLNMLRKGLYPYYNAKTPSHSFNDHLAHCIDSIRLSLQCHADTSLITFKWIKDYPLPFPDFRTYHTCRNWEDILAWSKRNMFDANRQGLFRHPTLGIVKLPEGHIPNPLMRPGGIEYIEE